MDSFINNAAKQSAISSVEQKIGGALGGSKTDSSSSGNAQDKYINQGVEYARKNVFGDKDISEADKATDKKISSAIGNAINQHK